MKKIKFSITGTFIIVCFSAIFAFTAEVKSTLPSPSNTSVNVMPAATTTQVKQPPAGGSAVNATPAATTLAQDQTLTVTPADNYIYNPSGKPDPFRPFVTVDAAKIKQQIAKKAEVSMFPLQRADTERYRVVGIAGDKDHRVAICEDSAKKFYPLYVGTRIGLYNGRVIEILADRVIVEEYETKKPRRVILKLRKN
ncbi:MAG: hypothetical protein APR62_11950 [Smithella sp. SDB]|nr:MAG: hypothetical protein APR62_11950 [Smithella sp. SDB]